MSYDVAIADLTKDVKHLGDDFSELIENLEKRDAKFQSHFDRRSNDEITIGILKAKNEMMKYTDDKINKSVKQLEVLFKTYAVLLIAAVTLTVSAITYINTPKYTPVTSSVEIEQMLTDVMSEIRSVKNSTNGK